MKSLKRQFDSVRKSSPGYSSLLCFSCAVSGRNFGRQTIRRWFNVLVEKDDYCKKDKRSVIRHIEELSKVPEDDRKRTQIGR